MFFCMYSANWTVSPDSPTHNISNLLLSWNILSWSGWTQNKPELQIDPRTTWYCTNVWQKECKSSCKAQNTSPKYSVTHYKWENGNHKCVPTIHMQVFGASFQEKCHYFRKIHINKQIFWHQSHVLWLVNIHNTAF